MIEIEGITKRYGETTVVRDVRLTIAPRTVTVIVGTSGSGKTTLLRMINRLVEPTSGTIRLDGEDNRSLPGYELRRRIGYAIQGHGLFPHRTVAQNIATVPTLLGWDRARIDAKVAELLTLFQLDPDGVRPALSARTLRRPAAARRRCPRACGRAEGAADGRALRRARPDHSRQGAGRPAGDPETFRND